MYQQQRSHRWIAGILVLWLLILSCGFLPRRTAVGETQTDIQTIELGSADQVKIRVNMGAGELSVAGGADNLLDASFRYNVAAWQPRVNYSVNGSLGDLVVDQMGEDPSIPVGGAIINEWELFLSNAVPVDLVFETGAGKSELDLHELEMTSLLIDSGVGITTVDLSRALDHDLNVTIHGGLGEITLFLPGEMGVRVSVNRGISSLTNSGLVQDGDDYVNSAYGVSPHTMYLDIQAGVGSINLLAP